MYIYAYVCIYIYICIHTSVLKLPRPRGIRETRTPNLPAKNLPATPSPPIKSLDFRGFDSSKLLNLRGVGIPMSIEFYRESPGKSDSRTLNRKTLTRWTGRKPDLKSK